MPTRTKSSQSSSKSINTTWWQDRLSNPRLTALVIMCGLTALVVHQLLPWSMKSTLANIVTYPVVTAFILAGIMVVGYFNWVAGLVALALLVFVILPYNRKVVSLHQRRQEGFTSNIDDRSESTPETTTDMTDTTQIKSLFQPGFLSKKLEEARNLTREVSGEAHAKEKMERFLDKRSRNNKSHNKDGKEKFEEVRSNGDKAIPMRRFNPGSEEDANLLLTMDAMDDIKDRIKFKYEDKKYLKRYIRQKLEEVVDLLDLVQEED